MRDRGLTALCVRAIVPAIALAVSVCAQAATLTSPGGGTVHSLSIGINSYPNLAGSNLNGARQDAEDIDATLAADGVKDRVLLVDGQATRASIIDHMSRLIATSAPGDLVIVSYAGHGMQVPEYEQYRGIDKFGVNEQIALSGFSLKGPGVAEVIVNEEVRAWLSRLNGKGVDTMIVWDSCFGGGMRSVAPEGASIRVRGLKDLPEGDQRRSFVGIEMTAMEARANVKAMSHVTFLAGADEDSVVPEMTGVDPANPSTVRGALSFHLARALEGRFEQGVVARADLYRFLKQHVRESTVQRESIQVDPQSSDVSISQKALFVISKDQLTSAAPKDAVRVAIKDGPADAFAHVEKGSTPLQLVDNPDVAELVWNYGAREALAQGDVLMRNIDGSMIGAVADRIRSLTRLHALAEGKPLTARLESGGTRLTPGRFASVVVEGLGEDRLSVFDIAADATVQMIYPSSETEHEHCREPSPERWHCDLRVQPPFGVDTLVAVATSKIPAELLQWLQAHNGKRDATALPELLQSISQSDARVRVGFVSVVTDAKE